MGEVKQMQPQQKKGVFIPEELCQALVLCLQKVSLPREMTDLLVNTVFQQLDQQGMLQRPQQAPADGIKEA